MTITNTTRAVTYTGNGSTTSWAYTYEIPDAVSAQVKLVEIATGVETVLATSGFSISGLGAAGGGAVVYPLSGPPLANTHQIVIYREVPPTQTTNITNQTAFYADVVMAVWDRIVMMMQEVTERINSTLRAPIGEAGIVAMPTIAQRASKFLAFDAGGAPIAADTIATTAVSTFMGTVLDDTSAGAARTTLGAASTAQGALADSALQNVVEDTTPQLGGPIDSNSHAIYESKGADVASAAELLVLTDGNTFDVPGTADITSIENTADAFKIGSVIRLQFDGVLTLTDNSPSLVVPGGSIITAAGDVATLEKYAAGSWRVNHYQRANHRPGNPFASALFHLQYAPASGTDGGAATAGAWKTPTLPTTVVNEIAGASIDGTFLIITLPAGTYYISAGYTFLGVGEFRVRLRNITDGGTAVIGFSGRNGDFFDNSVGWMSGRFTSTAAKTFRVQTKVSVTRADGWGKAGGMGTELFRDVKIYRL